MSWKNIVKELDEKIRVGDYIETSRGGTWRQGIIKKITISMSKHDPAGESASAVDVEEYDLSLGYQGSVVYGDNYWTYFSNITTVVAKEDLGNE